MRNIIVYRIANPIYHNPRTIITQITYCTDCMLLPQIPKIVRCNVVDLCNEKTVIIQFQLFIHVHIVRTCVRQLVMIQP